MCKCVELRISKGLKAVALAAGFSRRVYSETQVIYHYRSSSTSSSLRRSGHPLSPLLPAAHHRRQQVCQLSLLFPGPFPHHPRAALPRASPRHPRAGPAPPRARASAPHPCCASTGASTPCPCAARSTRASTPAESYRGSTMPVTDKGMS